MRYKLTVLISVVLLLTTALVMNYEYSITSKTYVQHEQQPGNDSLLDKGHTATQIQIVESKTPVVSRGIPLDGNGLPVELTQEKSYLVNAADPHPGAVIRSAGGTCPENGSPFCTHLPIVSIDSGGAFPNIIQRSLPDGLDAEVYSYFLRCSVSIYDRADHVNHLSDTPTLRSEGLFRPRGNSSIHFDKLSYKLHFVQSDNTENPLEFLGMEKHDKWVLHGPVLDKTLLRNYFSYNIAGSIRPDTPDVRFFELFINNHYQGLYLAVESVEAGKNRVPITPYKEGDPFTSYILRGDRDVNQTNKADIFSSYAYFRGASTAVEILYPPSDKLTPQLRSYIEQDISQIEKSLYSYDYNDPVYGYQATLDVDSFVDYFIINELLRNFDAGVYSTYYYKDIRGKLTIGPVWDFNNALDNYIDYVRNTENFVMTEYPIYQMICMDEDFIDSVIARYRELRTGPLSDQTMAEMIDGASQWLGDAITRNFAIWGYTFDTEKADRFNFLHPVSRTPEDYSGALKQMKEYLKQRCGWMDKNIETLKQYSHPSRNKRYYF